MEKRELITEIKDIVEKDFKLLQKELLKNLIFTKLQTRITDVSDDHSTINFNLSNKIRRKSMIIFNINIILDKNRNWIIYQGETGAVCHQLPNNPPIVRTYLEIVKDKLGLKNIHYLGII